MKRGIIVLLALVMLCTPILCTHESAIASAAELQQTAEQNRVDLEALRELLMKGLKVTRPVEEAFIDHVVILVGKNKMPVSLVYAAFRWARRRRPDYPFPYFESAIRALAKKNKIDI